jgi:hypothetical protein
MSRTLARSGGSLFVLQNKKPPRSRASFLFPQKRGYYNLIKEAMGYFILK